MPIEKLSPYDILENEVKIEGKSWDDDDCQLLWTKHTSICTKMIDFWGSKIDRGTKCFDYEKGLIFTERNLKDYAIEEKHPIQPRLMESKIFSLVGEIMKGRRSGNITTEGGSLDNPSESATQVSIANLLMKDMEQEFDERMLTNNLLHDGLVSCYPVWAWIEKGLPSKGEGIFTCSLLPWNSAAVAPLNFRNQKDITTVLFRSNLKMSDLIDKYPEMKSQIIAHKNAPNSKDAESVSGISEFSTTLTADDRSRVEALQQAGTASMGAPDAYFEVCTRVFVIYKNQEVAINLENPDDFVIKPPEWDEERWNNFIETRSAEGVEYTIADRKCRVLWQTVGTTSGLMLENKMHWYQKNGRMPGAMFYPSMIDMDVSGPGEKMLDNILMAACADTEFLDEVRKGSGSMWVLREGMISNASSFQSEVSKKQGALFIKQEFPGAIDQAVKNVPKTANKATYEFGRIVRQNLDDETRINAAMTGANQPNQAAIAKSMELNQALISQSMYVEHFNEWWETFQDLKCSIIPYKYSQYDVIEVMDEETGKPKAVEVNAPQVDMSGEIIGTVNDLTSCEFKFKIQGVDDSPSAKEAERQQALIFLNAVPGPFAAIDPSGELLAQFMMSMNNNLLKTVGKKLLAKAQERAQSMQQSEQQQATISSSENLLKLKNEAEKIKASKVSVSITGDQLAQNPQLLALLQQIGYFNTDQPGQPAEQPGAPTQPQQQPTPNGAEVAGPQPVMQ